MKDIVENYFKENETNLEKKIYDLVSCAGKTGVIEHEIDQLVGEVQLSIMELIGLQKSNDSSDIQYYLKNICLLKIKDIQTVIEDLESKEDETIKKLENLKKLVLPEQRSKEWYEIREGLLTASSLADSIGKGHFTTRDQLLINKTSDKKPEFGINPIMEWGVKYEPVATEFYEKMNCLNIVEFGLIPHPTLSVFGASPDGICDTDSPPRYVGRMLEIKCPPKRKFTDEVPLHYWMQMQGQLEVCDLEECDFLQVKIEEYSSLKEYIEDTTDTPGLTKLGKPKGMVVSFKIQELGKTNYSLHYEYSPWAIDDESLAVWKDVIINKTLANYLEEADICCSVLCEKYWFISRYECTLVRRDREWWFSVVPDIIKFWDEVVYYRKNGNEEVQAKINSRKRPRKITEKTYVVPKLTEGCHILSSSDEEDATN